MSDICSNPMRSEVPEGKEKEFADHIAFMAWETVCRGHEDKLNAENILKYITRLREHK